MARYSAAIRLGRIIRAKLVDENVRDRELALCTILTKTPSISDQPIGTRNHQPNNNPTAFRDVIQFFNPSYPTISLVPYSHPITQTHQL